MLIIKDWKGLIAAGISPEQDMVIKHFYYFGPVSSNLCKRINEDWRAALRGAARAADVEVTERPEARMRSWIEERDWASIRWILLGRRSNLDPQCRPTME